MSGHLLTSSPSPIGLGRKRETRAKRALIVRSSTAGAMDFPQPNSGHNNPLGALQVIKSAIYHHNEHMKTPLQVTKNPFCCCI